MKTIELQHSEITNDKRIVGQDKGNNSKSKITFVNDKQKWVFKTLVDGGVFNTSEIKKCDYKIELYCGQKTNKEDIKSEYCTKPANGVQYFIELKGRNIEDAIPQLESAIKELANGNTNNVAFIIFYNKNPRSSTENMLIKAKFKKKHKIDLIIEKSGYEYKI